MDLINNSSQQEETAYSRLYKEAKRLLSLQIENARLIITEKLTLLLGRIALVAVAFVVSATALIFLSMAAADFLLRGLAPCWTYLIIGGFYVAIALVAICFRRRLIVDPIARYISRVILDPPVEKDVSSNPVTLTKKTNAEK